MKAIAQANMNGKCACGVLQRNGQTQAKDRFYFWELQRRSCNVAVRRILDASGQYSAVCNSRDLQRHIDE